MDNGVYEEAHSSMFIIEGFCEHGNEPSGSIQEEKYLTGTITIHL
jgi:hypothetical protein